MWCIFLKYWHWHTHVNHHHGSNWTHRNRQTRAARPEFIESTKISRKKKINYLLKKLSVASSLSVISGLDFSDNSGFFKADEKSQNSFLQFQFELFVSLTVCLMFRKLQKICKNTARRHYFGVTTKMYVCLYYLLYMYPKAPIHLFTDMIYETCGALNG